MDEAFPHDALEQKIDKKEAEKRHFLYNALPSDMLLVKNGFPYITYFQEWKLLSQKSWNKKNTKHAFKWGGKVKEMDGCEETRTI